MRDSISPVVFSLHWLPVKKRVKFKICMFVYKALNGLAPAYIRDLLDQSSTSASRPRLRSEDLLCLRGPRTNLKRKGDRAFAVMAPKLWNQLPPRIKFAPTLETFRTTLKTHLFVNDVPW